MRARRVSRFWIVLSFATATAGGETLPSTLTALPEGNQGVAAKYPGDRGIETDKAVIFHDDFESVNPRAKWSKLYGGANIRITDESGNVHGGKKALEFTVPRRKGEVSNSLVKQFESGYDTIYLRYYSKFDKDFDQTGSSHNGAILAALAPGLPFATPGVRANGRNKFMASFENWRGEAGTPSPGELNIYCYHPEQRTEFGDHFFPSGKVFPFSSRPGPFGPQFVPRPDIIPELGRWYCFEFMLKANTAGQRDGRVACWLDGKLIGDFPNLSLRDVDTLKINVVTVDLHILSNPIRENKKWYDDVVVANSYIGPIALGKE